MQTFKTSTYLYEVLAKMLETSNLVFEIENKGLNTTTNNGSNFVKTFNGYGETLETVEEENPDEERSCCSVGNVDEDPIQPVRLLPILEGDNVEENVRVFLTNHMRCASHTPNLMPTTNADKTLNKCAIYKKYYRSAVADPKRYEINSPGTSRRGMS